MFANLNTILIGAVALLAKNALAYSGDLTYYEPGLGACGVYNGPGEYVAALPHAVFDPNTPGGNPNRNPFCGATLKATHVDARDGQLKTIYVKVVDRCEGCNIGDLDVSPAAFSAVADPALGRVHADWDFL